MDEGPDTSPTMPLQHRYLVAVIATEEDDRSQISTACGLEPEQRVVYSASFEEALTGLAEQQVDIMIVYVRPTEWGHLESLVASFPDTPTVLLTASTEIATSLPPALHAATHVRQSELVTSTAGVAAKLRSTSAVEPTPLSTANAQDAAKLALLTPREREILMLTAEGLAIKEIARRVHRSYATVATHRIRIMEKIGIHDKVALTRFAIRTGLVTA